MISPPQNRNRRGAALFGVVATLVPFLIVLGKLELDHPSQPRIAALPATLLPPTAEDHPGLPDCEDVTITPVQSEPHVVDGSSPFDVDWVVANLEGIACEVDVSASQGLGGITATGSTPSGTIQIDAYGERDVVGHYLAGTTNGQARLLADLPAGVKGTLNVVVIN